MANSNSGSDFQAQAAVAALDLPVTDLVPGARTLLVRLGRPADYRPAWLRLESLLAESLPPAPVAAAGQTVTIRVHYDGPDLEQVAALTGLDTAEVVAAHTGMPWRVAFGGFAPGFAYLDAGDPRLVVPRLDTPRTAVPPGAVALADGYSGIYPRSSPGGWQLIGRTSVTLWDPDAEPPALLRPGWWVRFVAADQ